jgi:hypothetical protein
VSIYSLDWWKGVITYGTSGDQVCDIIASWEVDHASLESQLADAKARLAGYEWIPVSERLPLLRDSKAVLVYTKSGEIYSGLYLGNNEWTGLLHDFREGEVTHWMPLPQPPEVQ